MIVGVLGGIGAGKSTVVGMLARGGAQVVDADALVHAEFKVPEVRRVLRDWFGDDVFLTDGTVDRRALGAKVFRSEDELRRLEALLHPRVERAIRARVHEFQSAGTDENRHLILDVPLLASSPLRQLCDSLVFVHADETVRQARVAGRGWHPQELSRRESFQRPIEEKRRLADFVIDNSGALEATESQVAEYGRYLDRLGTKGKGEAMP